MLILCLIAGAAAAEAPEFELVQPDVIAAPEVFTAAWADYDLDGDLDLAAAMKSGEIRLYRNDAGKFTSVGASLGLPTAGEQATALSWGDYDGNGYPDLYVGTLKQPIAARNLLFHNEAGKRFSEVAVQLGVDFPGVSSRQANWIDYDNDGDLDLFVANRAGNNGMFRNDGGRFVSVRDAAGLLDPRRAVGACWFDMDQDGDLDVFIANQEGDKDGFYRNDNGHFTDIAPELGMDHPERRIDAGAVGCTVADYDNDGDFDLFVATYGTSLLYRNDGNGHFTEAAKAAGVAIEGHMVGASSGDYDNDGRPDLLVNGYTQDQRGLWPQVFLFHNDGARFSNVIDAAHPLYRGDHAVQWADFDRDGGLDVVVTNTHTKEGVAVLRSLAKRDVRARSLQVSVLDRQGHATRAGSEVRLYDTTGRLLGTQLVPTGDGYSAQSVAPLHFGLPRDTSVNVEVTFLTAAGRKVFKVDGVRPRDHVGKSLEVRQP